MRDDVIEPIFAHTRTFQFRSATNRDPLVNGIVAPDPGSPGDPTIGGATLAVYNAAGGDECMIACLPPTSWQLRGTATRPNYGFRATDTKITRASIKIDKLQLRGGGASFDYTLDEAAQGAIAVRIKFGGGPSFCAEAGPRTAPPRRDVASRFTAETKTPPPPDCPPLPPTCATPPPECPLLP